VCQLGKECDGSTLLEASVFCSVSICTFVLQILPPEALRACQLGKECDGSALLHGSPLLDFRLTVPEDKVRITPERDQVAAVALASKESALAMQVEMQVDKAHIKTE
jgi:hypothetical protein